LQGLVLAGAMLLFAMHGASLADAVPAALFVFSGAIVPVDALPSALRPIARALPVTYWLEAMRRALGFRVVGGALSGQSDGRILLMLTGATAVFGAVALVLFRVFDARARDRGLIDRTSHH